jgi:predicted homoserine dehydrogenase-like protein
MALVANALDYRTPVPGMHGPRAESVQEVTDLFDLDTLWDGSQPVVDYILGAQPGGGIYVVGHCENPYQQDMMQYYKMGDGPYYIFYRPYHLCHVEAMQCVAEAVLDGYSLLEPTYGLQTNVFAYAKKDLKAGETLDGIGGYTCYGLIENSESEDEPTGLPICLADDVVLQQDITKDEPIRLDDVTYDPDALQFEWYRKALAAGSEEIPAPQAA